MHTQGRDMGFPWWCRWYCDHNGQEKRYEAPAQGVPWEGQILAGMATLLATQSTTPGPVSKLHALESCRQVFRTATGRTVWTLAEEWKQGKDGDRVQVSQAIWELYRDSY